MGNMFAQAWRIPAKTSTPVPANVVIATDISEGLATTVTAEHKPDGTIVVQSITQEPIAVIETPVGPDINVATTFKDGFENGKVIDSTHIEMGPIEVDLDQEEDDDWNKHGLTPVTADTIRDAETAPEVTSVIIEEKFVDIDTHEVVAETSHGVPQEDIVEAQAENYAQVVRKVNETLRDLGTATTEAAYTYGIDHLRKMKKDRPDDFIAAHIFGPSYDLWISEYDETNREFYGFASFGGISDFNAEWGYVSLDELLGLGPIKMERDFYWAPTTLESLQNHHESKEEDAKEQALALGADMGDEPEDEEPPRIPWQVEHENHIMLAGGPWFARDEKGIWREATDLSSYSRTLEEGDQQDIFFDTEGIRDEFFDEVNSLSDDIYCPIENEIITFGSKVDKSTFAITIDPSYKSERGVIYGIRFVADSWKEGYTRDKADAFIKSHFASNKGDSLQMIKDRYTQGGGGGPSFKAGTFENYEYDSKGCNVSFRGLQYVEDVSYSYTWKQVHDVLNTEIVQASLPISAQRVADEVKQNGLPFNPAEETASSTPDISWFHKPGYRKYDVVSRPTDRVNRLVGNMVSEHPSMNELYGVYSGKGGLHEVNYADCANFSKYTEAKQEFEMGEFYTPDSIAETMVKILRIPKTAQVMDSTCGMGRFFNFIPNETRLCGFDTNYESLDAARKLFPEATIQNRNIFRTMFFNQFGAIQYSIGNPPFNLQQSGNWHHVLATQADEEEGGEGNLLSQNAYVYANSQYLVPGGVSFFIVPMTWLDGLRHKKVAEFLDKEFFFIAELALDKKAFSEYGVDFATKALLLIKKGPDLVWDLPLYQGSFDKIEEFLVSDQYQEFLKLKKTADLSIAKSKMAMVKNSANANTERLYKKDKVLKAIYETFRGYDMEDKKNFERRETEMSMYQVNLNSYQFDTLMDKQAKRLNKAISRPERTKVLNVEFIISRYDIILKRSNTTVTEYFNRDENKITAGGNLIWLKNKYSKNDLCTDDSVYQEFKDVIEYLKDQAFQITYYGETRFITSKIQSGLIKYIDRIREEYKLNTCDTEKLKEVYPIEYEENMEKLTELQFPTFNKAGEPITVKLLPHQNEDLAGALLKRNALISWDTGLGKTLGGIVWSMTKGGKTLVIAPAVNTIDPWLQQLKEYRPDATVMLMKKSSDIYKYNGEDYLIVSLESLPKIYKVLATFQFRNLILDESDNAKNKTSKRFKSLRAIAKRFKNRLLMSGTPTRNNVNEIYNQIELLCQNSRSMMCWADEMIEYDRSSREWDTCRNPHYGQPFPAWGGHKAFENTFSPKKLTCFGAAETNQDIFNKDILDTLIRSIRFTRIFDVEKPRINAVLGMDNGDGIYKEYKQVMVPMNKTEEKVYDYILTDLANQMEAYYRAIHDGATASMLVIMQQIMKLMQGTSHPWTFTGYEDGEGKYHQVYDLDHNTSTKLEKACEIIDEVFKKEGANKIMMASPWRETDEQMFKTFTARGYKVFRLTSDMTKHNRAKLVTAFRSYEGNAIICGTMGCLKSGLNLPEVNTVIAESYPWNFAQLHQYAARAIRLNSTEKTDIYCLTSEGSFDVNVFSLILRKEVANTFVRTSQETSMAELSKNFGVESTNLFDQAMQMVKEKTNGRTRGTIKWGGSARMVDSDSSTVTITYEDKEKFMALAQ